MSEWKISKSDLATIKKLGMKDFLEVYDCEVRKMSRQLSRVDAFAKDGKIPQRTMFVLRQITINVEHLSKIYRKKSVELMKQHKESLNANK